MKNMKNYLPEMLDCQGDKRLTMEFPTANFHEFSSLLSECGKVISSLWISMIARAVMRFDVSCPVDMFSSAIIATYGNCNQ